MIQKKYYLQHITGNFAWDNKGQKTLIFHDEPLILTNVDLNTISALEALNTIKLADGDTTYFNSDEGEIEWGDTEILDVDGTDFIEIRVALANGSDYAFKDGKTITIYEQREEAFEEICLGFSDKTVDDYLEFALNHTVSDDGFEYSINEAVKFDDLAKLMDYDGNVMHLLKNIKMPVKNQYSYREVFEKETYPNNPDEYNVSFEAYLNIPKIILK